MTRHIRTIIDERRVIPAAAHLLDRNLQSAHLPPPPELIVNV